MLDSLILNKAAQIIDTPILAADDQDRVIFVNRAFLEFTDWSEEEVQGKDFRLFCNIPQSGLAKNITNVHDNGILYKRNGQKMTLQFTSTPLTHPIQENICLGIVIVFHLQEISDSTGPSSDDFVSTVSHELRTPLTSIKGFADTLMRSGNKLQADARERCLRIIKEQADHVTRLVEDLLLVSRLDNHKIHLACRPINLKARLDKVCEAISNQSGGRVFIYNLSEDLPQVEADSDRLEQILTNLLSNAIKYSDDHTSITIQAQEYEKNPALIKVSVKDQGIGIDSEHQDVIFKRFSRLDNPLTRQTKGVGLGLYITRSLVRALGGEIWLEKSDQEGTVFAFTIKKHKSS